MFRSAIVKLTLWYLGFVMAISLIFSFVLYQLARNEISRGIHAQYERIYNQYPIFNGTQIMQPQNTASHADHDLLLRLVAFNIIVLICAGFISYYLAYRTLAPIEEAHEQQKRFTADVSHELRTPLTALRMESEVALLNPKSSSAELRATLESNLEEASKLEALINSLLRLTRLEADELRQNFVRISALAVAENAVDQIKKVAEARHIDIETKIKDALLFGDSDSLAQLLVILLDNAIKYSSSGSSVLLKSTSDVDYATFSVQDHGIGIEKAALEHIFDRFYRADSSRTKSGSEGYGLGLSIAKMIAEVHGGVINVTSQAGKGTTVTVRLPLHKPETTTAKR